MIVYKIILVGLNHDSMKENVFPKFDMLHWGTKNEHSATN